MSEPPAVHAGMTLQEFGTWITGEPPCEVERPWCSDYEEAD